MKNLMTLFTVALFLVFTSCTKEELLQPETDVYQLESKMTSNEKLPPAIITSEPITEEFSSVNQLQVSKVFYSELSGELFVGFASNFDFSSSVLEDTQYLDFEDGSGSETTATLGVNDYNYSDGVLYVTFAIGANSFIGWDLKQVQSIIIEDEVVD